jgi:Protein of unknown function (DUF3575)
MKKPVALLVILFITNQLFSQDNENRDEDFQPSFAIKWNPESIYFGKLGLFGEYNFSHKHSVNIGVGIPLEKSLSYELDNDDRSIKMKTFSIMGSYRMYLGKQDMSGVYFEPYIKYVKNDASLIINADLAGNSTDFATTSKYSGVGIGGQIGVQFLIAKRVTIDLFFIGPEANTSDHKLVMHDISSTGAWDAQEAADAQKEIEDDFGDLPIVGGKLDIVVDANARTVSSHYKGFLPGFRSGLSLGFRF